MRFRKRINLFSGFSLNISKSGLSSTIGTKGLSINTGKNGSYLNTGIPGTGIYDRQKIGSNYNGNPTYIIDKQKSKFTTGVLCFLLGILGIHRFYTGHFGIGIIQLFTLGGFGLWTFIDFIMILTNNFKDAKGNNLV